jgi:hypothetical protein
VYAGFIREEQFVRLAEQFRFKSMDASSLDLERIRQELVLVDGVSHLRAGKLNEDAVLALALGASLWLSSCGGVQAAA